MSPSTFPYPTEPAVAKNPYRQRVPQAGGIPTFSEAQSLLPTPVLPERPVWVEMYWRAWEVAWGNLRRPKASSGLISGFIDAAFNENIFMWDSAFMVLFGLYGRRAFPFIGTLDNFYAKQHADGFICREINFENGDEFFYPFDPNGTGPNILAWAEWRFFRQTGDDSRLSEVFWPLLGLHRWFKAHRTWPSGLYWATGLSSGMDNQTRVPESMLHHRQWTWVDANMQASLNCLILTKIAALLGEEAIAASLIDERLYLLREVNARLWDRETGFYKDMSPDGRLSPVKSIGAYWALLDKEMVSGDRRTLFLQHLRESTAFKRPHRIPSQSADSEGYDAEGGNYWRGGVWAPTNYMVLKGLRGLGEDKLAHEIAVNHLENIGDVFQHTDTFWENYAPEMAAPGQPAKPDFVGWTGLAPIAVLFEEVIGLQVDWPLRRIVWDRRLQTDETYGVRDFPLGEDGKLSLLGDQEKVTVTTNVPFTLTIQTQESTLQTALSTGTTEIDLT